MANTLATTKNWAPHGDKTMDASTIIVPHEHAPLSIVAPKSMIQSIWEEEGDHNEDTKHHHTATSTLLGAATSSLAKFKAAQETENLPHAASKDSATTKASSATSSSALTATPGTDTSSPPSGTTPAPPSSTGKKRRRRTAAQIDRKFSCNFPGCPKAYGSEGSLTQHQRLKHRQQQPDVGGANSNTQLGSFFLPLHRAPARSVASGAATHRPNAASSSRTVNIRPASIEGVMSPLSFDMSAQGWADASAELLMGPPSNLSEQLLGGSAANSHRQNLRSRSNSMPVSFSTPPSSSSLTKQSSASSACTPRPHVSRKPSRVSCTPRGKSSSAAAINHRRGKCRSKSETLSEVDHLFLGPFDAHSDRSGGSDTMLGSTQDSLMPLSNTSSRNSYDWSSSLASDSPHDSDQAIDSDILSVLADCDPSEMGDATSSMEFTMATSGSLSSSSYRSHTSYDGESEDQDMLPPGMDCFGISDHAPSVASPTGGLRINDLFRRAEMGSNAKHGVDLRTFEVHSEWARSNNSREDTMYLSTHLENVAISSPPSSLKLEHQHGGSPSVNVGGSPSSSILPNLEQFPSVSIESFAVKEVDELVQPEPMDGCDAPTEKNDPFAVGLENHSANWSSPSRHHTEHHDANAARASMSTSSSSTSSSSSSSSAVVPKPETSMLWMKEFANSSVLTPLETQHQYVDDVFHEETMMPARGPHEWKPQKGHTAGGFQVDKQASPSQGFTGMLLGDFLFDPAEYGLEDTRMGSPLLCQQEEL
uniref:C2H2-type domain-containing protein n=1 Tax=Globisporangium ultimum (strain ATCC 200006 / CBS 805.95 / DAOM BR144) TaxID=431595 RepID=K3WIR3_GLOUD